MSQATLSFNLNVWAVEDGFVAGPGSAWIALANNTRPTLKGTVDA
jgi:hypothetical protein